MILLPNKYYLGNISIDSNTYNIGQNLRNLVCLDYDYIENEIYFIDVSANAIFKSIIDSAEKSNIVHPNKGNGLVGKAVDWVGRKLYWLDKFTKQLSVSILDSRYVKALLKSIDNPRAIALHPEIGYIFYTSWNLQAYIGRVGMDGSNHTNIVSVVNGDKLA